MSTPISSASTASTAASPSTVISSQGVGSGLDIAAIVTSLTSAKAAPLTNAINRSNTALNAQVSAWGTFNSAVATFQAKLTDLDRHLIDQRQSSPVDQRHQSQQHRAQCAGVGLGHLQ